MAYDEKKKYKLYKNNVYKCLVNINELIFLFEITPTENITAINDALKPYNYKVE